MEKDLEPQISSKIVCFSSYTQTFLSPLPLPLPLSSGLPLTRSRQPHSFITTNPRKYDDDRRCYGAPPAAGGLRGGLR